MRNGQAQACELLVMEVHSAGLISDQVALRELQYSARRTGRWKAITDEIVEAASKSNAAIQGRHPLVIFMRFW